jgi:hypothetical protein
LADYADYLAIQVFDVDRGYLFLLEARAAMEGVREAD